MACVRAVKQEWQPAVKHALAVRTAEGSRPEGRRAAQSQHAERSTWAVRQQQPDGLESASGGINSLACMCTHGIALSWLPPKRSSPLFHTSSPLAQQQAAPNQPLHALQHPPSSPQTLRTCANVQARTFWKGVRAKVGLVYEGSMDFRVPTKHASYPQGQCLSWGPTQSMRIRHLRPAHQACTGRFRTPDKPSCPPRMHQQVLHAQQASMPKTHQLSSLTRPTERKAA